MNKFVFFSFLFKVSYSQFIEGDILIHEEKDLESDLDIAGGVKLADPSKLWPGGFVYYRFDQTFRSPQHQTHVENMMRYIESKVDGCITFEKSDTKVDFVSITAGGGDKGSGTSCFSDLGRIGGKQILNLDISCLKNHTIVHELMHTIGFSHEHNRPDRDLYITVFPENILESKKGNFRRRESGNSEWFEPGDVDTLNTPFDFMSVLLYPPFTSSSKSVSKNGKKTLEYKAPIIPSWPNIPQNEEPLSIIDTVELGLAYTCQLDQDTLIQYVHYNRLSSSQKISNLETKLIQLDESSSKHISNLETKLVRLEESSSKRIGNLETKFLRLLEAHPDICEHSGQVFFFGSEGGRIMANNRFRVGLDFDIAMMIKPKKLTGILAAVKGRRDYLILEMIAGSIKFSVDNGRGPITAVFNTNNPNYFRDNEWHEIHAVKAKNVVTLSVDKVFAQPGIGVPGVASTDTDNPFFLGGHSQPSRFNLKPEDANYFGYMKDVVIEGTLVSLSKDNIFGDVF